MIDAERGARDRTERNERKRERERKKTDGAKDERERKQRKGEKWVGSEYDKVRERCRETERKGNEMEMIQSSREKDVHRR